MLSEIHGFQNIVTFKSLYVNDISAGRTKVTDRQNISKKLYEYLREQGVITHRFSLVAPLIGIFSSRNRVRFYTPKLDVMGLQKLAYDSNTSKKMLDMGKINDRFLSYNDTFEQILGSICRRRVTSIYKNILQAADNAIVHIGADSKDLKIFNEMVRYLKAKKAHIWSWMEEGLAGDGNLDEIEW